MTPLSVRKLIEQVTIVLGLVLALAKSYGNWKVKYQYHNLTDLIFCLSVVTLITSGLLTALFFLIHQVERKWRTQMVKGGSVHPWQIRSPTDCGIVLLPLFPMALLLSLINFWSDIRYTYMVVTVLSVGFMFTSMAFLWKTSEHFDSSLGSLVTVSAISSVKIILALWHLRLLGLAGSCMLAFGSQLLFLLILRTILSKCTKAFSIGEALMVAQTLTSLLIATWLWILAKVFQVCGPMSSCYFGEISTQLSYALAIGVTALVIPAMLIHSIHKPCIFYSLCAVIGGLCLYPTWYGILKEEPALWLLHWTMLGSMNRSLLILHWLACTVLSVTLVGWAHIRYTSITTTIRKVFHAAVILIYMPGFAWDLDLLFLASSVAFTLFIGIECVRVLKVPPFGNAVDIALRPFLDEKDSGNLILTHIYLLIGCSIGMWIFPLNTNQGFHVSMASGILALGFGDTAASIMGVFFGKHKWPDTKKTLEGSFFAFLVQAFSSVCLYLMLSSPEGSSVLIVNSLHIILASAVCCLLEGVSAQIDNLFLPVFTYIMLVAT